MTAEEIEEILQKYFPGGTDGPLKTFYLQEKHKLVVLREIAKRFRERACLKGELAMNRREELKQMYKEVKPQAGVYQIKNTVNGKF